MLASHKSGVIKKPNSVSKMARNPLTSLNATLHSLRRVTRKPELESFHKHDQQQDKISNPLTIEEEQLATWANDAIYETSITIPLSVYIDE